MTASRGKSAGLYSFKQAPEASGEGGDSKGITGSSTLTLQPYLKDKSASLTSILADGEVVMSSCSIMCSVNPSNPTSDEKIPQDSAGGPEGGCRTRAHSKQTSLFCFSLRLPQVPVVRLGLDLELPVET